MPSPDEIHVGFTLNAEAAGGGGGGGRFPQRQMLLAVYFKGCVNYMLCW